MERKYPTKMFWLHVLANFLLHFLYLFIPGIVLCIVGIWVRFCLWIGLALLVLDMILSIIEQLRIRKATMTQSNNPEFNELIDAFCGPDNLDTVRKVVGKKIMSTTSIESQQEEN